MLDENERLMIRVITGSRSSKHRISKLAGTGSRQQDFLALLRMRPRNSVSVVGMKQSSVVLNRGLSSEGQYNVISRKSWKLCPYFGDLVHKEIRKVIA